jgi:hypothetical protein
LTRIELTSALLFWELYNIRERERERERDRESERERQRERERERERERGDDVIYMVQAH